MTAQTSRPLVEILYFDGCPNYEGAKAMVERVGRELGLDLELRLVDVRDEQTARRLRFPSSPTIRVDGRDIDATAAERDEYALSCRVYRTENGFSGQPDEHCLRDALLSASTETSQHPWSGLDFRSEINLDSERCWRHRGRAAAGGPRFGRGPRVSPGI